jgi:DnaJ-domain-containing protein 1
MIDFFALLEEPRRPWLDPDSLKGKFLALSAELHPDRLHNAKSQDKQAAQQRYTDLNAAFTCLREPRQRLRHLLELELGAKPQEVQVVPANLMNISLEVSRLCREADALVAKKAAVSSPLLKVELFEPAQTLTARLMNFQQKLTSWEEQLVALLKSADAEWLTGSPVDRGKVISQLAELYSLFGYFGRWRQQVQERIVQLAL